MCYFLGKISLFLLVMRYIISGKYCYFSCVGEDSKCGSFLEVINTSKGAMAAESFATGDWIVSQKRMF